MKFKTQAIALSCCSLLTLFNIASANDALLSSDFAGTYGYGHDTVSEDGPFAQISIHPTTTQNALFHIEINRGAPSFNSGALNGYIEIENGATLFLRQYEYEKDSCHWKIQFQEDALNIETINHQYACNFGNNVYADGVYQKISSELPMSFQTREGTTVYFEALDINALE